MNTNLRMTTASRKRYKREKMKATLEHTKIWAWTPWTTLACTARSKTLAGSKHPPSKGVVMYMLLLIPLLSNHLVNMLNCNENILIFRTACHKHNIYCINYLITLRKEMLLWPEVCCFSCMNKQLKCKEMFLRNFLYSLEHCIAFFFFFFFFSI